MNGQVSEIYDAKQMNKELDEPRRPGGHWIEVLSFRVNGVPKGQPRPVVTRNKNVFTPSTANEWKDRIRWTVAQCWDGEVLEGPVRVDVTFYFPRPQRLCRKKDPPDAVHHIGRPDVDNCHKTVLDCFTHIGLFKDDGQVADGRITKFYHAKGEMPGAFIKVSKWEAI